MLCCVLVVPNPSKVNTFNLIIHDIPAYVDVKSNHPPAIPKNIPLGVNRRLSRISANETVFNQAAPAYQAALDKSGYSHKLLEKVEV